MPSNNEEQLSEVQKKILTYLLEHRTASAYELMKNIDTAYSTAYEATQKLNWAGILRFSESKSKKRGTKKLWRLTPAGKTLATKLISSPEFFEEAKESTPRPLDDVVTDFMFSQKRESAELDFKLTLDTKKDSLFPKICKDIFAMSNYGGGYLLFGFSETKTGTFDPVGLDADFDFEPARVQEKFNSYSNEPLIIDYRVVERAIGGENRKFVIMYIPPSTTILQPIKDGVYPSSDGRRKKAFSKNQILIRRGTQSVPATIKEVEYIKKRSQQTEYKIGLLKGKPDRVSENLFGNFFEVVQAPAVVFEARLPQNIKFSFSEIRETPFVRRGEAIYSFCDLTLDIIGKYIRTGSVCKHEFKDFLEAPNLRNILKQLLDIEIRRAAKNEGLSFDRKHKTVYFYPTNFVERQISWEGRSRKSKRFVVRKLFIQQEAMSVFVHSAASISFHFIGVDIYLEIVPKIVLTYDGHTPVKNFREGPVKTRLSYNQYNDAYLNHVLFWASRFKTENALRLGFGENILVRSQPVIVKLNVGIRRDRQSEEFSRRRNELYSVESMKEVF